MRCQFRVVAFASLCSASPLLAQCPDGSPPPCARGGITRAAPAASANSIAVLYFDNLSRDSSDAYLAEGLTDEIIVRLQHIPRLDVKSRYEVRRLRGTQVTDARSVGRDLRVAWLVTGSVRPSPSRMRVSYELVRASDGRTVVSDIIDTTAADQWAISSTVSTRIARSVAGELAPAENAALSRGSRDAQAVDLYRRGVYLESRGVATGSFDRIAAIAFFRSAVERDSTYAEAWAALAWAWGWVDSYFPNRVTAEQGRVAGARALALDSTSGGAAAVLYAMQTVDYDWAGGERLGRRAIELNPRDQATLLGLSAFLLSEGKVAEADAFLRRAWEADSLNPQVLFFTNAVLTSERRWDELLRWGSRVSDRSARFRAHLGLGHADSALALASGTAERIMALAAGGRMDAARDSARAYQQRMDSLRTIGAFIGNEDNVAIAWAAVGDLDRAFASLEISFQVRSGSVFPWLKVWPGFDPLRNDPRYHDLLRRMHLE